MCQEAFTTSAATTRNKMRRVPFVVVVVVVEYCRPHHVCALFNQVSVGGKEANLFAKLKTNVAK